MAILPMSILYGYENFACDNYWLLNYRLMSYAQEFYSLSKQFLSLISILSNGFLSLNSITD